MKTKVDPSFLTPNHYFEYFYDRQRRKRGVLAAARYEGEIIGIGYSLCSKSDSFDPNRGLTIAFGRAAKNAGRAGFESAVPFTIQKILPKTSHSESGPELIVLPHSMSFAFITFFKNVEKRFGEESSARKRLKPEQVNFKENLRNYIFNYPQYLKDIRSASVEKTTFKLGHVLP